MRLILNESEIGYINDFIKCSQEIIKSINMTKMASENELKRLRCRKKKLNGEQRDEEIKILEEKIISCERKVRKIQRYIKEFEESLLQKELEEEFFYEMDLFSDYLVVVANVLKKEKAVYGGKKLKVDFLIFHLLEKDIASGIVRKVDDAMAKAKKDRKFMLSILKNGVRMKSISRKAYWLTKLLISIMPQEEYEEKVVSDFGEAVNQVKPYRDLCEYYFDKKETFTEKDILHIMEALKQLGINEELEVPIRLALEKKIENRKQVGYVQPKKVKPKINTRSWNEVQAELLPYYDLDKQNVKASAYITSCEVISCISLLNELGANKGQIETFMTKVNKFNNDKRIKKSLKKNDLQLGELSKYYDLSSNMVVTKEYITKEEIVRCVFILRSLWVNSEIIQMFLNEVNKHNAIMREAVPGIEVENKKDVFCSVQRFGDLYGKLEFYASKIGFEEEFKKAVENYNDCCSIDIETEDDCECYFEYQSDLETRLDFMLGYINPSIVEYEIEVIKNDYKVKQRKNN